MDTPAPKPARITFAVLQVPLHRPVKANAGDTLMVVTFEDGAQKLAVMIGDPPDEVVHDTAASDVDYRALLERMVARGDARWMT